MIDKDPPPSRDEQSSAQWVPTYRHPSSPRVDKGATTAGETSPKAADAARDASGGSTEDELAFNRKEAEMQLPSYIRRLIAGYEFRAYWYEIFECCALARPLDPFSCFAPTSSSHLKKPY